MTDHDKSLFDRAKDALGMGDDRERQTDDDRARHPDDGGGLGVDGATQATGSEGTSGSLGASGAMGGAGAGGPVGATPDPSDDLAAPASGDRVRTEYEMGNELDPEHEKVAESGVVAERADEAEVDTWRNDDDEGTRR